jgi:predicted membrane-bound dolichyl-phosphate-mannose-protein mannosyltransferase
MTRTSRIGSIGGALLAAYFIPAWTVAAWHIVLSPVRGLYERPSVAVALYLSDHLGFSGMETVRAAWLLALVRLTVAAFFAAYLMLLCIPRTRKSGSATEALALALGIGGLFSFACMLMASHAGEAAALKLHATEVLMMVGAIVVLVIDAPERAVARTEEELTVQPELLHNG